MDRGKDSGANDRRMRNRDNVLLSRQDGAKPNRGTGKKPIDSLSAMRGGSRVRKPARKSFGLRCRDIAQSAARPAAKIEVPKNSSTFASKPNAATVSIALLAGLVRTTRSCRNSFARAKASLLPNSSIPSFKGKAAALTAGVEALAMNVRRAGILAYCLR